MAHPAFRWSRLLPITALLVVTTGLAAAPIRQAWLPIVARPLGLTIGTMPTMAAPAIVASDETIRRDNVELAAPFTNAPDRQAFRAFASTASATTSAAASRQDARTYDSPAWTTASRNRRGGSSAGSSFTGSGGGSVGSGGSGGLLGSRAAPSIGPPRSYSKTDARGEPNRSSGSGSVSGGGGNAGRPGGGNATGPGGGSTVVDGIFKGHTSGLPELTGNGGRNGNTAGGGVGVPAPGQTGVGVGPNLAANPEPSTILLLGTGLAAVAGAVRRRLRG